MVVVACEFHSIHYVIENCAMFVIISLIYDILWVTICEIHIYDVKIAQILLFFY